MRSRLAETVKLIHSRKCILQTVISQPLLQRCASTRTNVDTYAIHRKKAGSPREREEEGVSGRKWSSACTVISAHWRRSSTGTAASLNLITSYGLTSSRSLKKKSLTRTMASKEDPGPTPPPSKRRKKKEKESSWIDEAHFGDQTATSSSDTGEKFTFFFGKDSPFSQWHPAHFVVDDVTYNCAEQYMMHQKAVLFRDVAIAAEILKSSVPKEHKALGRKVSNFDPKTWNTECRKIVKAGNMAKVQRSWFLHKLVKLNKVTVMLLRPSVYCVILASSPGSLGGGGKRAWGRG